MDKIKTKAAFIGSLVEFVLASLLAFKLVRVTVLGETDSRVTLFTPPAEPGLQLVWFLAWAFWIVSLGVLIYTSYCYYKSTGKYKDLGPVKIAKDYKDNY